MRTGKNISILIFLLSLLLIVLDLVRVCNVSITHDEAITYRESVLAPYKNIVSLIPITANNHIFNSLSAKVLMSIFGDSLFVLRLPNIIALLIFLFSSYRLVSLLFDKPFFRLIAFLLLNLNPFLFDFWGLARGYGLSIGFMMLSLYACIAYFKLVKIKYLYICLAAAILAVYSNFALLNFYLTIFFIIGCRFIFSYKKEDARYILQHVISVLVATIVLYILIVQPLIDLRRNEQLYFGGDTGLVQDTFFTLVRESTFAVGNAHIQAITVISWVCAVLVILPGIYWATMLLRNDKNENAWYGLMLWTVIFIPCLLIQLQHTLVGTKFLIERTALFLYPLFMGHLAFWAYHISYRYSRAALLLLSVITLSITLNFLNNTNAYYTRTWEDDRDTIAVLDKIKKTGIEKGRKMRMHVFWLLLPSVDYYQKRQYTDYIQPLDDRFYEPAATDIYDFYYTNRNDINWVTPAGYALDTSFGQHNYLYRKTN